MSPGFWIRYCSDRLFHGNLLVGSVISSDTGVPDFRHGTGREETEGSQVVRSSVRGRGSPISFLFPQIILLGLVLASGESDHRGLMVRYQLAAAGHQPEEACDGLWLLELYFQGARHPPKPGPAPAGEIAIVQLEARLLSRQGRSFVRVVE